MKYRFAMLLISILLVLSCSEPPLPVALKPAPKTPPPWSSQAIWYQIMVDRFHNGDPSNDPTISSIEGAPPGYIPDSWEITPWTQNWYTPDAYFTDVFGKPDMDNAVIHSVESTLALRRYGGDLQGVINKLDYLVNLGINAIYINPINDAPSALKYDARYWHHVDANFGPDPSGDRALMESEDPSDPTTWKMTQADTLFFELIKQAKARDIRLIVDFAWHQTGQQFWAWQNVVNNPQNSPYSNWYSTKTIDSHQNDTLGGSLPTLQTTANDAVPASIAGANIKSVEAKNHILAATRRWLDPNGDGDPSDGVDGFKLSHADQLPLAFWQEYRIYVKSINPNALLVGETSSSKDARPFFSPNAGLQGDTFDALIHFDWYQSAKAYFTPNRKAQGLSEFTLALSSLISSAPNYASNTINKMADHDSARLLTSLPSKLNDNKAANNDASRAPSLTTINKAKLLLLHQFTFTGAPHIWAGDEMGMWGGKRPHNMKPLMWPEYAFEPGTSDLQDTTVDPQEVVFNQDLFSYYQFLVKLRRANPVLSSANVTLYDAVDSKGLFSYLRYDDNSQSVYVLFNMSKKRQQALIPNELVQAQSWLLWHSTHTQDIVRAIPSEQMYIDAESAAVITVSH